MSETELIGPTQPLGQTTQTVATDVTQSMQGQAAGMIALDVESFSNGFMQIMLAGIGWASAEIASTEGAKGEDQLTFFTQKLSADLPLIIQNITAATNGSYAPSTTTDATKPPKSKMFSK